MQRMSRAYRNTADKSLKG